MQIISWDKVEATLTSMNDGIPRARLVLLFGPPGTGKTTAAFNAAKKLSNKSVYNVTLSEETPAAELRGHWIPQAGGKFGWMDGPAMLAYRQGAMLVLNEIDKASNDCLDFLHGLLDDKKIAAITLPNGETVFPGDSFQCVATMNGNLEDLPDALRDRFSVAIQAENPHPDAIASLPEDLQSLASNPESYSNRERPVTIRRLQNFAALREDSALGSEIAAQVVFGNRATELLDALRFANDEDEEGEPSYVDSGDETYPYECDSCGVRYSDKWDAHYCCR